MNIKVTTLGSL